MATPPKPPTFSPPSRSPSPPPPPSTPPLPGMTLLEPTPYVDPTPATPLANSPSNPLRRRPSDMNLDRDNETPDGPTDPASRTELQSIMLQFSADGPKPTPEEVMSPRLEIASPVFGGPAVGAAFGGVMAAAQSVAAAASSVASSAVGEGANALGRLGLGGLHQYPTRKSSLEPLSEGQMKGLGISPGSPRSLKEPADGSDKSRGILVDVGPPVPPKDAGAEAEAEETTQRAGNGQLLAAATLAPSENSSVGGSTPQMQTAPQSPVLSAQNPASGTTSNQPHHRPPPPEADPEPALPFDFQRFLEQLRHRKADPIARYLKSFLSEFGKKQWMVHEQVKIIGDFLAFITNKMAVCEVWANVSDAEFDNAREGMEKLVMNRLYSQTFSPVIPPPAKSTRTRRGTGERTQGPGRRGQHQEDVERDDVLTQKINIYGWIRPEHLDIPPIEDSGKRFLKLAQDELLKIKTYRAPRDKMICVLNCCKVIFGLLKHAKSDSSADSFMPLLIYVVLHSNPEHLVSNVQYILRFRNQDKLSGEAGYYLSSLMGAIHFIENMDRSTLTISDEEFDRSVEAAVSAIAEKHRLESPPLPPLPTGPGGQVPMASLYEKVNVAIAGTSAAGTGSSNAGSSSTAQKPRAPPPPPASDESSPVSPVSPDQPAPLATLFQSIQKPLTTIGRMFVDEPGSPPPPPPPPRTNTTATLGSTTSQQLIDVPALEPPFAPAPALATTATTPKTVHSHHLSAEEAAARQANAEAAEALRLQRAEHADVVETLAGMFPDLDRDIISDVVHQKQGRVGLAVDACLALSS